jgi:hypothetical protein
MYNPSLTQEPRYEPAAVLPLTQDSSLLDWLSATGRLIPRDREEGTGLPEEDLEIAELMDVDSHIYDDEDLELNSDGDLDED